MPSMTLKTIIGEGTPVTVSFYYQPEEPQTLEYPGCDESVEIEGVHTGGNGTDIIECLSPWCIDKLEQECLKKATDDPLQIAED